MTLNENKAAAQPIAVLTKQIEKKVRSGNTSSTVQNSKDSKALHATKLYRNTLIVVLN